VTLRFVRRVLASATVCVILAIADTPYGGEQRNPTVPLHSRRAWHQVALVGSNVAEERRTPSGIARPVRVLAIADGQALDPVAEWVTTRHGKIEFTDRPTAYLRAIIPAAAVGAFAAHPGIAAWQLDGPIDARGNEHWERIEPSAADPRRALRLERERIFAERQARDAGLLSTRNLVDREHTERYPYQPDAQMGVDRLIGRHPSFDGRGVTVAIIESGATGIPVWHPLLRHGLTLDGREVRKVEALDIATDGRSNRRGSPELVRLSSPTDCRTPTCTIAGSSYNVGAPGRYEIGIWTSGKNPGGTAILRERRGVLRVDVNGDRNFNDEAAVRDLNTCDDASCGRLTLPSGEVLLLSEDLDGRGVIVHPVNSSHALMVATVATGRPEADSYGRGVAPGARLVLMHIEPGSLYSAIEGFIRAARMTSVDVLSASIHYLPEAATTDAFSAQVVDRIVHTYRKPIVFAAGNNGGGVATEVRTSPASTLAVGGLAIDEVVKALMGVVATHAQWIPPIGSNRGPTLDGALRPDLVVPNQRVSGRPCRPADDALLLGSERLPPCYGVSSGTSAAAPTAAGLLALLISGLKQQHRAVDVDRLLWAMRASSTPVTGVPINAQGAGVPQLDAAWNLYVGDVSLHRILVQAPVRHVMDAYLADRDRAAGLFEREGWRQGRRQERTITLQRVDGPSTPSTFRLHVRGDRDTFSVAPRLDLPLGTRVRLPVTIQPERAGVHSALIEVLDPTSNIAVAFVPLTIVVGEPLEPQPSTHTGDIGPLDGDVVLSRVPAGTHLLRADLQVYEGAVGLDIDLPSGRNFSAPEDLMPFMWTQPKTAGRYTLLIPEPEAGTWSWTTVEGGNVLGLSTSRARYALSLRRLHAQLVSSPLPGNKGLEVRMLATNSNVEHPELRAEIGTMSERTWSFEEGGLPTVVSVAIAPGTQTLVLEAEAAAPGNAVEMTLYDCTTGRCALFDDRLPAAVTRHMRLSRPAPGMWKVIVGPGPGESSDGHFRLKTIRTHTNADVQSHHASDSSWLVTPPLAAADHAISTGSEGGSPIVFLGLIDGAAAAAERRSPMGKLDVLSNRPAFVTTEIVTWPKERSTTPTAAAMASPR
jgi:hypothetical protein